MRGLWLALLFASTTLSIPAQSVTWRANPARPTLTPVHLTKYQETRVRFALSARTGDGWQDCAPEKLTYSQLNLGRPRVFLVEAGVGCGRGGQGSNGEMWLVDLGGSRNNKVTVLTGPKEGFQGWLRSVEPTTSHGLRDVTVGWHMSAFEAPVSYFRFNGAAYERIATATQICGGGGDDCKIEPGSGGKSSQ